MNTIPESAVFAAIENAQKAMPVAVNAPDASRNGRLPLRCSICGKPLACCYPETVPGVIFATCRSGHKIKFHMPLQSMKSAV